MEVEVAHSMSDDCRVDVLGALADLERATGTSGVPAERAGFGSREVAELTDVPARLDEQVAEIDPSRGPGRRDERQMRNHD